MLSLVNISLNSLPLSNMFKKKTVPELYTEPVKKEEGLYAIGTKNPDGTWKKRTLIRAVPKSFLLQSIK